MMLKVGGGQYLTHINAFVAPFADEWFIAIVLPLKDYFGPIIKARQQTIFISLLIILIAAWIVVYFSKRISGPITALTREVDKITHFDLESEKRVKSQIYEINLLDRSIAAMRAVLRSFGRYVPKEIVKPLMEQGQEIALGGTKQEITVFFSDIEDFTPITESLPVEDLMAALDKYFDEISKIILAHNGTIDKYIGDSVMAFWGAPNEVPDPEASACISALSSQKAVAEFNERQRAEGKPPFATRIGIHSGLVIVGNIGTSERMNYTIIGDTVNSAARLQQVNKIYQTSIIISEEVYEKVKNKFLTRPIDVVAVKGKSRKLKIYELVAQLQGEENIRPKPEQEELCRTFSAAYATYEKGDFEAAKREFTAMQKKYPNDTPTKVFLDRLANKEGN